VQVSGITNGAFDLYCTITSGTDSESCIISVVANSSVSSTLANQIACLGEWPFFTTQPAGDGPFTYVWRKDGELLSWATEHFISITNATTENAGEYCVEVSGFCDGNTVTNCATLTIILPPELTCPSNLVVNCASDVPLPNPDSVLMSGGTNLFFAGDAVTTNACGLSILRTYSSINSCGNTSSCTQLILVANTNPPVLSCGTNRTVECGTPWDFDVPSALDFCGNTNVTIKISSTVTNPLVGQTFWATRTWNAIDSCSNSATCIQTITLIDTTPPEVTCPANMNVAEAPRDSGFATVTFPAPVISDVCDNDLAFYYDPPSGSSLRLGTNLIHCTVVDHSRNSNTCSFAVRVIPYRLQVTVTSTADSGPGSFRQALMDANDSPDENLIVFDLPGGSGPIQLLSALPEITSPVLIDGWSQPGFSGHPLIELDGSTATNGVPGLVLRTASNTVRGLVLHGFTTGIQIESSGNIIQGNFIGPDLTGTNAPGNSGNGIWVGSSGNLIGGTDPVTGNVISANATNGIVFSGAAANNNTVQGNLIGKGADQVAAMGNGQHGILFDDQSGQNLVGGANPNTIAHNSGNGITLSSSAGTGNALLGNSIFDNHGLGIDLGDDGVSPNDSEDTDSGPNNLQNFPALTDAQSIDGVTTVFGELATSGPDNYRLDFFLNNATDDSGYGEGKVFLGTKFITVHGNGTESFTVTFPITATYTQFITATATGPLGDTSEFSRAVQVRTPPVLGEEPIAAIAPPGGSATFCATASGTPPITYQWRLNGVNIPGATNACYAISAADVTNGGSYTILMGNGLGALATIPVSLTLPLLQRPGADNFVDRVSLEGLSGVVAGDNKRASLEHGEPLHAGKLGGRSIWYSWIAPVTGVTTFRTLGSTFDTLLAIYSGSSVTNLTTIDSDEDRGGFYTSKIEFNSIRGKQYQIAIDGFDGSEGDFVLTWSEQDTPHLQPYFLVQPRSQTVAPGSDVTFDAVAVRVCGNGHNNCPIAEHYPEGTLPGLTYQWYFMGIPIPGATSNSVVITNVQAELLGAYTLRVSTLWQTVESQDAILQINITGSDVEEVKATDKLADATDPLLLGGTSSNVSVTDGRIGALAASSVVRGYSGTQIFNTAGSATSPGEIICGVIGGASEWISLVAEETGNVLLNTDGSSYDTVVAVFRRSPTNSTILQLIACDNNNGTNGLSSSLSFPVVAGQTNYIDVDGVNGATGILQLNYSLATSTILKSTGVTPQGEKKLQVLGRANMHFSLQASTNLTTWTTLITTNCPEAVFDYIDTDSISIPKRYYRALLLP